MKSHSPLFKVDHITILVVIPMLIDQGTNDPSVKQPESEQIVETMKSKGIDCQEPNPFEGDGLVKALLD